MELLLEYLRASSEAKEDVGGFGLAVADKGLVASHRGHGRGEVDAAFRCVPEASGAQCWLHTASQNPEVYKTANLTSVSRRPT